MKLPNFRRLFDSDYDESEKPLVKKLSGPINSGVEVLYEALNNKLTFRENLQASVRDVQIQVDANGIPEGNATFTLISANRIDGVFVLRLENLTNSSAYPLGAPFITWSQSTDRVTINHVTGLIPGNQYSIRLVAT